jgi:hypothetical protein
MPATACGAVEFLDGKGRDEAAPQDSEPVAA